jgi:hypothetical protein
MPKISLIPDAVRERLTKVFAIPCFFWTNHGVDSNGFFGSKDVQLPVGFVDQTEGGSAPHGRYSSMDIVSD